MSDRDWLRTQRESLGWTQQQLADALHVTQATVSRVESGERSLTVRTRAQVIDLLGSRENDAALAGAIAEFRLPGDSAHWHGFGGALLSDCPNATLYEFHRWCTDYYKRADRYSAELVAIESILRSRRAPHPAVAESP